MDAIYVGIDVSKNSLDVHLRPMMESFGVARNGKGIEELIARLLPLAPACIAVEATGGFEKVVIAGLAGAGLPVATVNPAQVRAFADAAGKRAKTDLTDAAVIAHLGRDNATANSCASRRSYPTLRRSRRSSSPDRRYDQR